MTRAVASFTVTVRRRRIRVRVLPTVHDVHRACPADSRPRGTGKKTFAFFQPYIEPRDIGTIVLPRDKLGPDLVAHEATHAAIYAERMRFAPGAPKERIIVDDAAEERIAEFAGLLSDRITRRLNEVLR